MVPSDKEKVETLQKIADALHDMRAAALAVGLEGLAYTLERTILQTWDELFSRGVTATGAYFRDGPAPLAELDVIEAIVSDEMRRRGVRSNEISFTILPSAPRKPGSANWRVDFGTAIPTKDGYVEKAVALRLAFEDAVRSVQARLDLDEGATWRKLNRRRF
jgi:hypothetical protein